MKPE